MDLFDILLVKKLIGEIDSEGASSNEIQKIMQQLKEKVNKEEMELYVTDSLEKIPVLTQEEIIELTK